MERRIRRGEPILFDTNRNTMGTDMSSASQTASQSVNAVEDRTPRVNPPNVDGPTNNHEEPSLV